MALYEIVACTDCPVNWELPRSVQVPRCGGWYRQACEELSRRRATADRDCPESSNAKNAALLCGETFWPEHQ